MNPITTIREALSFYPRADLMLRYASLAGVDQRYIVLAAALCARRALRFVSPGEFGPLQAIEAAEAWAKEPTKKNEKAARIASAMAGTAVRSAASAVAQIVWDRSLRSWVAGRAVLSAVEAVEKRAYNKEMRAMADIIRWSSVIWICDTRDYITTYTPRLP